MSKHGKRLKMDNIPNQDFNFAIFDNPDLMDAYLESMGVGASASASQPADSPKATIKQRESSYSNGPIDDMLKNMANGNNKTQNKMPNLTAVVPSPAKATKEKESKIAFVDVVRGVRHLIVRDSAGNATSVPVRSGETHVRKTEIGEFLRAFYEFRIYTGVPFAIYDANEFVERFTNKGLFEVNSENFVFAEHPDTNSIFAYAFNDEEEDEFVDYIKDALTYDELGDTILSLTSIIHATSIMTATDPDVVEWFINTYIEKDTMKETFEELVEPYSPHGAYGANLGTRKLNIEIENVEDLIRNCYGRIGNCCDISDEPAEEGSDQNEEFDPYPQVTNAEPAVSYEPSNNTFEEGEAGAPDGVRTFHHDDDAAESGEITGETHESTAERNDFVPRSVANTNNVPESTQSTEPKNDEKTEETKEPADGGYRGSADIKENEEEKVQTGNGYPEITNVEPSSFSFEEEEEKESMVIEVRTVGR